MNEITDFLIRSSEQCGFNRSFYLEKNIPDNFNNITIVPFFGDLNSTCIFSSLILHQYKNLRPNQYIILATWPGFEGLFPYVDEFWYPKDSSCIKTLALHSEYFDNSSDVVIQFNRSLFHRFEDIADNFKKYYFLGFQDAFWDNFKEIRRFYPNIPSISKINGNFINEVATKAGQKVVVMPTTRVRTWQKGKGIYINSSRDFWVVLTERLLEEGITPVILQNNFTYDLSPDFADRCVYLTSHNILDVLSSIRHIGCLLDVHSNISLLSDIARCASVIVDERMRYHSEKDDELDLLFNNKNKQYIFSFATLLTSGDKKDWDNSIIDTLIARLHKFLPTLDKDNFETTTTSNDLISYKPVLDKKIKKLGTRFIRKY